ncbi:MAG: response regulator [Chloroflexota bacterium]
MANTIQSPQAGKQLFEAFVEQVKQALEHLYDFAYLQQHPLARVYDGKGDLSTRTGGRQLRQELISAIESFKPKTDLNFRAPDARIYNILHLIYVENLGVQEAAGELGLSERQAYRDLKRGQELIATTLWDNRLPSATPTADADFSPQSEIERLKLNFSAVDIVEMLHRAQGAVERLAVQHGVEIIVSTPTEPITLSTDPALATQIIVSMLSFVIQQSEPGEVFASFEADESSVMLTLRYNSNRHMEQKQPQETATINPDSIVIQVARRLRWTIAYNTIATVVNQQFEITLRMPSGSAKILVIDDNEGWASLLERFLEGSNCIVVPLQNTFENLDQIDVFGLSAIILDVMMPERDGWQILQSLRANPTTKHIPIIVCTVFNDPQLAYSLGASAFLSKPTTEQKFLATLREVGVV